MKNLIKKILVLPLSLVFLQVFTKSVYAVCPVCTIAVSAGLGLSRFLGIDDTISGIWLGGLIISTSLWTADWLNKKQFKLFKKLNFVSLKILSFVLTYLLVFIPLHYSGITGHPLNTILGIDKLYFGSTVGIIVFLLAVFSDKKARQIKGRQFISYQKVIFPIFFLALTSIIFYLLLK